MLVLWGFFLLKCPPCPLGALVLFRVLLVRTPVPSALLTLLIS